jgi:sensor histidine kinase YesM
VAADIQPREVMVPGMMLQPHLENAIWHGLSHKPRGDRRISIWMRRDGEHMVYVIADNGIGRARAAEINARARKSHRSKGLDLLDKRMALIRERFDLQIDTRIEDIRIDGTAAGTRVTIRTPAAFALMTDALQA